MTATPSSPTKTPLPLTQRHEILGRVLTTLHKRFYAPERLNDDWQASVERHRPAIEAARFGRPILNRQ